MLEVFFDAICIVVSAPRRMKPGTFSAHSSKHIRMLFKRWSVCGSLYPSHSPDSKYVLGACGGHGASAVHARSGLGGVQRLQRPEGEGLRAPLGSAGYACLEDRGVPLDFAAFKQYLCSCNIVSTSSLHKEGKLVIPFRFGVLCGFGLREVIGVCLHQLGSQWIELSPHCS